MNNLTVYNIGYIGIGKYNYINYREINDKWRKLLCRCYNFKDESYKYYGAKGITVCDEWLNFQNFAFWYEENSKWNVNNYPLEIDKDILSNIQHLEKKVYSPSTCLLIPSSINCFLMGDCLNIGIWRRRNKFISVISHNNIRKSLGTFNTFSEAKLAYAKKKYEFWLEEINKFDLSNELIEILLKYDFSWNLK